MPAEALYRAQDGKNLKYLTIMMQFEISPLRQPSVDDDSGRDDIIYGVFDNLRLEFVFHTTGIVLLMIMFFKITFFKDI